MILPKFSSRLIKHRPTNKPKLNQTEMFFQVEDKRMLNVTWNVTTSVT